MEFYNCETLEDKFEMLMLADDRFDRDDEDAEEYNRDVILERQEWEDFENDGHLEAQYEDMWEVDF